MEFTSVPEYTAGMQALLCWLKKLYSLKVENVLFGKLFEELSRGGSCSGSSEELLWRGKGGARIYRGSCNENQVVGTVKDYCYLKTSQVNEFSASLCMGRCKSLGPLKSFLWYAP